MANYKYSIRQVIIVDSGWNALAEFRVNLGEAGFDDCSGPGDRPGDGAVALMANPVLNV